MSSPSQRSVAAKAGVDRSTVSLALRGDPRIPPATRTRIQAVARELGYRRNPLISLVFSHVRRRDAVYRGTLVFLKAGPPDPGFAGQVARNFVRGAKRRAQELGYRIDELALRSDARFAAQVGRTLTARNIRGMVVHHSRPGLPDRRLPIDISKLATASIGIPFVDPPMHYATNDHYTRPILAAQKLLGLGYRRLGLLIDERFDLFTERRCTAGFGAVQQSLPELEAIPILKIEESAAGPRRVRQWLRRHRPDAILAPRDFALCQILDSGCRVPKDVGFAHLDWHPSSAPAAGVSGNNEQLGAAAIDIVVSQLLRGEQGPPEYPLHYFFPCAWMEGDTVRRIGPFLDLNARFFGL